MNVIWITGLPGSGKTTLAKHVQIFLQSKGINPVLLDGDEIRVALGETFGYTKDERLKIARIYANMASILKKQGHTVVVSTVSLMQELHEYRKNLLPEALVILIKARSDVLDSRNQKQLRDEVVMNSPGVTMTVEFPEDADFVLTGTEQDFEIRDFLLSLNTNLK